MLRGGGANTWAAGPRKARAHRPRSTRTSSVPANAVHNKRCAEHDWDVPFLTSPTKLNARPHSSEIANGSIEVFGALKLLDTESCRHLYPFFLSDQDHHCGLLSVTSILPRLNLSRPVMGSVDEADCRRAILVRQQKKALPLVAAEQ